jgi:hypothetical protein
MLEVVIAPRNGCDSAESRRMVGRMSAPSARTGANKKEDRAQAKSKAKEGAGKSNRTRTTKAIKRQTVQRQTFQRQKGQNTHLTERGNDTDKANENEPNKNKRQ